MNSDFENVYDSPIGKLFGSRPEARMASFYDQFDEEPTIETPTKAAKIKAALNFKLGHGVPPWYVQPEQQLERAHHLWSDAVLPQPPRHFTPVTESEVLLLHVPDTFDSLWDKVAGPEGYTKLINPSVMDHRQLTELRLVRNDISTTHPVWLAFDPEFSRGQKPYPLQGWNGYDYQLAASEVLSALIQFPEWPLTWSKGSSTPYISGYEVRNSQPYPWPVVLYMAVSHSRQQLELSSGSAFNGSHSFASPSVRKC